MVRRIFLNLIISGFVLWLSSMMFPEQIHIKDFGTLAFATILLWIVTIIVYGLAIIATIGGIAFQSCGLVLLGIIIVACPKLIAFYALDAHLPGFTVEGFWLKVLLAFACSIFAAPIDDYYCN